MSIPRQKADARRAWICSVLAATVFWTALVAFGIVRADYSQLTKAVSELGAVGAPHALGWNVVGFIVPGLLLAACGAGIGTVVDGPRGAVSWLLMGSGAAFAGTGVFPAVMQQGSPVMQAPLTVGHVVMLLLSSVLWLMAIGVLLRKIRREPRLRRLQTAFVIVSLVAVSGLAANVLHNAIQPLAHRPGLAQRLGFAGYFLWFLSVPRWIAMSTDHNEVINDVINEPGSSTDAANAAQRPLGL
jgi:hypothetical membrane protein